MKFEPRTQSLILDAERVAQGLRLISGRSSNFPEGWSQHDQRIRLSNNSHWVSSLLTDLYKEVKHLIPSPRAPYWNQVNRAVGSWGTSYGNRRNWAQMSIAYDRVLEAIYAAQDREDDE